MDKAAEPEEFAGPVGTARRIIVRGNRAEHAAFVRGYIIDAGADAGPTIFPNLPRELTAEKPPWTQWSLYVVHLRDIEGQEHPPHRQFPGATYELALHAIHPDTRAYPDRVEGDGYQILSPVNVVIQFRPGRPPRSDEEAAQICDWAALGIVQGTVPLEGGLLGRVHWGAVVSRTIEHMELGGHPEPFRG